VDRYPNIALFLSIFKRCSNLVHNHSVLISSVLLFAVHGLQLLQRRAVMSPLLPIHLIVLIPVLARRHNRLDLRRRPNLAIQHRISYTLKLMYFIPTSQHPKPPLFRPLHSLQTLERSLTKVFRNLSIDGVPRAFRRAPALTPCGLVPVAPKCFACYWYQREREAAVIPFMEVGEGTVHVAGVDGGAHGGVGCGGLQLKRVERRCRVKRENQKTRYKTKVRRRWVLVKIEQRK